MAKVKLELGEVAELIKAGERTRKKPPALISGLAKIRREYKKRISEDNEE